MQAVSANDDVDDGVASARTGRERSCALTRQVRPVAELIRFVVGPDAALVADLKQKLPGRGLWLTATRAALEEAVKRNVFSRGFKREVAVPANFPSQTEAMLARSALDALAVAAKAGQVVAGSGKVEDTLARGEAVALIHAREAAADGTRKIAQAAHRNEEMRGIPAIDAFSSEDLDLALGRLNVIHAALLAGPVSETFLARTERLHRFRTGFAAEETLGTDSP